jgi:hypothetical protein
MKTIFLSFLLAVAFSCAAQTPLNTPFTNNLTGKSSGFPHITALCKHDTIDLDSRDTIIYTLNFAPDSVSKVISNKDISLLASSNNWSQTTVNKISETKATYAYVITPGRFGVISFPSPLFYFKGYSYKFDTIRIFVNPKKISKLEQKNKSLNDLISVQEKPDNTMQIVMYDEIGYYGVWTNGKFNILKALNAKQIEQINKILK